MALVVCEGMATAHSIHECAGLAVAAAFSAGNLEPVARALRRNTDLSAEEIARQAGVSTPVPGAGPEQRIAALERRVAALEAEVARLTGARMR